MIIIIVVGILALASLVVFVLASCRVASDADEQEERMERDWEARHGHD